MDEYKCPMIEDARNNLRELDIEQKERRLKTCKTNLEKLTEEIAKIEKELEELRNS
jgi:septal ring factor EnvC (AmiA/AmiB activator)